MGDYVYLKAVLLNELLRVLHATSLVEHVGESISHGVVWCYLVSNASPLIQHTHL